MSTEPNNPNLIPEMIPPSDIEGLTAQIGVSSVKSAPPVKKEGSPPLVFRRLSAFSTNELRKLRARQEEFIRSLAARLSGHLRLEVGLTITQLESMPFGKWLDAVSNPTYLSLLKLEPLKGICLLEIPPQLGLSIVDRELGGAGVSIDENRALTEIESRILSRVVEMSFSEWCQSWSDLLELRPALIGHESNGAFVQNISADTVMLVLSIEMQMGEVTKQIHFGFPHLGLEPLIQKLDADAGKQPKAKPAPTSPKWNRLLDDVNIKITADLPVLKITTRELANMKAGDVIPLDPEILQNLHVSLAKKQKFLASAGRCESHWAARITKVLEA
jgi:flagellar motor switch protein FliM